MNTDVMFSSATDQWPTPIDLFVKVDRVFKFDLDVCADAKNAKCERFFSEDDDGLSQDWTGVCWMNPPYGRDIGKWVEKAHKSAIEHGATVVCLLPARTDTRWWQNFCLDAQEVHFIKGRLKFGDAKNSAPFPSALVVFRPSLSFLEW